jgi:hypothetical protein
MSIQTFRTVSFLVVFGLAVVGAVLFGVGVAVPQWGEGTPFLVGILLLGVAFALYKGALPKAEEWLFPDDYAMRRGTSKPPTKRRRNK